MSQRPHGTQAFVRDVPGIGSVRFDRLIDVGQDGASFAGSAEGLGRVEIWRLREGAANQAMRRRIAALRALLHGGLLPIHAFVEEATDAFLVVGAPREGAWNPRDACSDDPDLVRREAATLLEALAAAHQLDVVHGWLGLEHLARLDDGRLVLDLTGLSVRGRATPALAAPELAHEPATSATDVWSVAAMLHSITRPGLLSLEGLLVASPVARPSARAAAEALGIPRTATGSMVAADPLFGVPPVLGGYRLVTSIGAGAMGRVFRAQDVSGAEVALKVVLPHLAADRTTVARLHREARLLAQLQTPHAVRFLAVNEDAGFHFLVMELVRSTSAHDLLKQRKRLAPELAVAIACDVARALAEVHQLGLVHRDVKPANVLVDVEGDTLRIGKLCDFGIARRIQGEAGEALTRDGSPGTPMYMAPEQLGDGDADARTDVYALGVTLYAMLAGRPPFEGPIPVVYAAHVLEPPTPIRELEPSVPPGIADVVMRCLAKAPADRYADGGELLDALRAASRGRGAEAGAIPQAIGLEGAPRTYDFRWTLQGEPSELWPFVSNTERINRAAGLDEVEWSFVDGGDERHTEGRFRAAGLELRWKENPFEWIAPRRLGVVREYIGGPFAWMRSTVELTPLDVGGTELRHRVELLPRGILGRAAAAVEVGLRLRRALESVYRHIDEACIVARSRPASSMPIEAFESRERPPASQRARVEEIVSAMVRRGADPLVARAIADDVLTAPSPTLARLRPRAWARERGLDEAAALDAFLAGAAHGLVEMSWDILCPTCRAPGSILETLAALRDHGRCEACDLDFELDLARSVELVFRAHRALREVDVGVYCIGGPGHAPHVAAQVRIPPGSRFTMELALEPGRYAVTGRGLPHRWQFNVDPRAPKLSWQLALRCGPASDAPRLFATGRQVLVVENDLPSEALVRVEREGRRTDAFTAAEAACNPRFRELFPEQVLAPDQLVAISDVALLYARVADALGRYELDERLVHRELLELATALQDASSREGGGVVRLQGDGVLSVFSDRLAATRAALDVAAREPRAGVALHAGSARATNIGGRLDYFGRTLHLTEEMAREAGAGDLMVGEPVLVEPAVAPLLRSATAPHGVLRVGSTLVGRLRHRAHRDGAPHA